VWGRRIVSVVLGALMASAYVAAPSGAAPEAGAWAGQNAFAEWTTRENGGPVVYVVIAVQGASQEPNVAGVARSVCKPKPGGGYRCPLSLTVEAIGPTDLMIDPTMESATLDASIAGQQHRVTWTARPDRQLIFQNTYVGRDGAGFWGARFQDTKASGSVFGHELKPHGFSDYSYLARGAVAGAWLEGRGRPFDVPFKGTTLEVVPR